MNRKAFTLIELLVVIGVIAILMSILIPSLSKARESARDALCKANLHGWAQPVTLYLQDYKDTFWRGFRSNQTAGSNWWMKALEVYYAQIDKIRCCPKALKTSAQGGAVPFLAWGPTSGTWWGTENQGYYGSYAANGWVEDKWTDLTTDNRANATTEWYRGNFWRKGSAIEYPEEVPLMTDSQWLDAWPQPRDMPPATETTAWSGASQFARVIQNRHEGHQNMLFCDGGSRAVPFLAFRTFRWHRNYNLSMALTEEVWKNQAPWLAKY